MNNFSTSKKVLLCITLLIVEFILYMGADFMIKENQKKGPYTSTNEFLQTIDCAELFDKNPNKSFLLSFDIRAEKPGKVLVYQQNGSTARYSFYKDIDVTQEYQTFQLIVEPRLVDVNESKSLLAFYGEYGSGVIPEVKNISISVYDE